MNKQEIFELLEDYLEGRLDDRAKVDLESKIASDVELREQLELLTFTKRQLKDVGLWREINSVHETFKSDREKKSKGQVISLFGKKWIGIAASFLLIFAFISISLYQLQPSKIVDDNYIAYKLPVMRSEEGQHTAVELFYQQRDWDNLLSWVEKEQSPEQKPYFFAGLASYEKGAYSETLNYFNRVGEINARAEKKLFEQEMDFYSSLTYLQLGEFDEAYRLIDKMKENRSHVYHDAFGRWDRFKIRLLKLKKGG
ncbi:anti-sigma factor family protein [Lunatibacter salilacus]|uniref:anti-sigma factor family protein n=1 Tax=Lunatibacter salilacus TaxID=2483804 RepID=UPI00131E01E6|nr:hypothetical protein [Lunatibacter salilacus]